MQVLDLAAVFAQESRGELRLRLQVNNADVVPGSASAIKWEVYLQRHWFAEGEQSLTQPLAPKGATEFEVRLPIAFVRTGSVSAEGTSVEFLIRGILTAQLQGSEQALSFQRTLRINAPGAPIWTPGADEG